jgi:hypothetical protein
VPLGPRRRPRLKHIPGLAAAGLSRSVRPPTALKLRARDLRTQAPAETAIGTGDHDLAPDLPHNGCGRGR